MKERFAIPCTGAIIYKIENNDIFVVIQTRQKTGGGEENGLIELPAGKIREYEDIQDALKREVFEETGLKVCEIYSDKSEITETDKTRDFETKNITPYYITQNLSGGYSIILMTFLCKATGVILDSTDETQNIEWVNILELRKMLQVNREQFFPMHILALKKFINEYEKIIQEIEAL